MHRYVGVQMLDGAYHDGIVEHVDEHQLYLAVPTGDAEIDQMRAFSPFGYGYSGYGYPRRRFRRRILPLGGVYGLSLLPYY
jgi:hypothetical protein